MADAVTAFAPATVANVTCGFDVLGFAIEAPGDRVAARRRDAPGIGLRVGGEAGDRVPDEPARNTAGVAVALERAGGSVVRAGIGLTGVGSATIDAEEAAGALVGTDLDAETIDRAADLAAAASNPRSDHRGSADYKRHVVATFVRRILTTMQPAEERVA